MPNGTYEAAYDAEDGNGLVLTLNASIQSTLEKYLQNAVDQYHVENRAVGIVMDVNTGAILAMATMPDYNLQEDVYKRQHKGHGVSFMEDQVGWHGKAPNKEQYEQAMKELGVSDNG